MAAPCGDDKAGSSPAPQASAHSGRLEAGLSSPQPLRRLSIFLAAALVTLTDCAAGAADAQTIGGSPPYSRSWSGVTLADFIAEASQRFGVPNAWITAIMRVESGFNPRAISPKGAMGLMQMMPETWEAMQARFGLGHDPYDPHDNVLAGVGYLRILYDQFGAAGFLAAYNAGPERYLDFITKGRALPPETRRYVAGLASTIGLQAQGLGTYGAADSPRPAPIREALFAPVVGLADAVATRSSPPERSSPAALEPARSTGDALFPRAWGKVAP
jgi:soluble lytic murein transglycosylase-like protein